MSFCDLPQSNIYQNPTQKYINSKLDKLEGEAAKFLQDLNEKVKESKRNLDRACNPPLKLIPSQPPRDLEKERITKLRSAKNKAIIYAAVLIACVAVNILLLIFLPIPQALLSLLGFAPLYYFLGSSLVGEIKDYNSLKQK